ncbi:MAG: putative molybdenum carrier protein [Verrucomicrobiota bacterium]
MLSRIVSGGQTGADRAALDWAISLGYPIGGWCPAGRRAEDGPIDLRYPLQETADEGYTRRTEWNVRDSDATLIVTRAKVLTGGSQRTQKFAIKWNRPCFHAWTVGQAAEVRQFLDDHAVTVLNIAGPRLSTDPEILSFVDPFLTAALPKPPTDP